MAMGRGSGMRRPALFLTLAFGFVGMAGMSGALGLPAPVIGAPVSDGQKVGEGMGGQDSAEPPFNPHGNLVFRVTGATSCRDCHAAGRSSSAWPVLDNELVRVLVAKGKGAHAGRFADCFRCHPGGRLPSERP
ncbi:hypothetical protein DNFV4_04358 [Nitrospira tepida]|uniref:Uncharacterized protein n=2 Tax=Nitrospira tepida TaxID=2973512 RepID=A0AA86T929_9BACT|nr:hypothetical protein DNFV4_04358 [Nitrospira tepida]